LVESDIVLYTAEEVRNGDVNAFHLGKVVEEFLGQLDEKTTENTAPKS